MRLDQAQRYSGDSFGKLTSTKRGPCRDNVHGPVARKQVFTPMRRDPEQGASERLHPFGVQEATTSASRAGQPSQARTHRTSSTLAGMAVLGTGFPKTRQASVICPMR